MQSISQWFITEIVPAFSRTLVHSFWLGIVAAVLAAIVIGATRKSAASKRYNGLLVVYFLFLVSMIVTFGYQISSTTVSANQSVTSGDASTSFVLFENLNIETEAPEQSLGTTILSFVDQNAVLFFGLWALLFILQLVRMSFGLRYVHSVKNRGILDVESEWKSWVEAASKQLGITKKVMLLQSRRINVPVALGFLKPVILVPVGLLSQLPASQVEAILLHELAHIRRNDYLVNLLQNFADAIFFFNPAARWISAQIREARETCCDDKVVQYTANKKGYVEALVSFSQWPLSPAYAMGLGSTKTHLLNRVKTIITRENSRLTGREQATLMLGLLVVLSLGAFAFKPKEKEVKEEPVIEKSLPVLPQIVLVEEPKPVVKKKIKNAVAKPRLDTIPAPSIKRTEPKKWRNMVTNITDDGEGKTTQVIATDDDGTVYRLRKIDDQVVLFSVNDREIKKENYSQYAGVINSIEQTRNHNAKQAALKREQKALEAKQKQKFLFDRREAIQQKQVEMQQRLLTMKENKKANRKDSLNKLKQVNLFLQKKLEQNQKSKLFNEKKEIFQKRKMGSHTNSNLPAIISDIMANRLAENETKLSFTLTDNELTVNGKPVDKNVFEVFRKKYIRSSGDRYIYSRDGGNTSTTVNLQ